MSNTWKHFPQDIPADGQQCYIRIKYYYGAPFVATYDELLTSFTVTGTNLLYPFFVVARWQSVI